jgi:hypothetical protein
MNAQLTSLRADLQLALLRESDSLRASAALRSTRGVTAAVIAATTEGARAHAHVNEIQRKLATLVAQLHADEVARQVDPLADGAVPTCAPIGARARPAAASAIRLKRPLLSS